MHDAWLGGLTEQPHMKGLSKTPTAFSPTELGGKCDTGFEREGAYATQTGAVEPQPLVEVVFMLVR